MKRKVSGAILAVALLLGLAVVPVMADSPTALTAEGETPREAQVVINMPEGTTLGSIESISWQEYLVNGYPPHVDVFLDLTGDGKADDALVFEYAYNADTHYSEAHTATEAYGAQTGAWYATFSDDGNGPDIVTDTSFAWLSSGAPGPYPPDDSSYPTTLPTTDFVGGTLADWKAGCIVDSINADIPVLRMEFEVDSWIKDTTALIKDIAIDTTGGTVGLSVTVGELTEPDIVAISVDPSSLDFGTVYPGTPSSIRTVTVTNTGTVVADVTTVTSGDTAFVEHLAVDPSTFTLAISGTQEVNARLDIPETYVPRGPESGTLTFEVAAATP